MLSQKSWIIYSAILEVLSTEEKIFEIDFLTTKYYIKAYYDKFATFCLLSFFFQKNFISLSFFDEVSYKFD